MRCKKQISKLLIQVHAKSIDITIRVLLLLFTFFHVGLLSSQEIEWQRCLGGNSDDLSYFIQQTLDNGYIVAGYTSSTDGDVIGNHGDILYNDFISKGINIINLNSNGFDSGIYYLVVRYITNNSK